MESLRNPNAMREAMRSQDLAMSQLENLPGGFNALRRMYEEVQEPMMQAASDAAAASSTTTGPTGAAASSTTSTPAATAPSSTALPNPWSAPPAAPLGFGGMGGMGGMGGLGGMGGMGGMGANPGMAAMMQDPFMQQMMQQMLSDPNVIQQVGTFFPSLESPSHIRALLSCEYIDGCNEPRAGRGHAESDGAPDAVQPRVPAADE